jgi:hypothetical protein
MYSIIYILLIHRWSPENYAGILRLPTEEMNTNYYDTSNTNTLPEEREAEGHWRSFKDSCVWIVSPGVD